MDRYKEAKSYQVSHRGGHELHDNEELAGAGLQNRGIVLCDILRLAPRQCGNLLRSGAGVSATLKVLSADRNQHSKHSSEYGNTQLL